MEDGCILRVSRADRFADIIEILLILVCGAPGGDGGPPGLGDERFSVDAIDVDIPSDWA